MVVLVEGDVPSTAAVVVVLHDGAQMGVQL
jgi:hypothetical protein